MPSIPVVKRFFRHECTRCAKPLVLDEEVWCGRCAASCRTARRPAAPMFDSAEAMHTYLRSVYVELARINSLDRDDVRVTP